MLLSNIHVDYLFKSVEIGVSEELYIADVRLFVDNYYTQSLILENNQGEIITVKIPYNLDGSDIEYSVGNPISVMGVLKLNTDDLFYLDVEKVIHYGIGDYEPVVDESIVESGVERNDPKVRQWREAVINRDKVCQCCGGDKHLEAHHIFSWHDYPDLRVDVDNGVALCSFCHHRYNSYFGHKGTGIGIVKYLNKFRGR